MAAGNNSKREDCWKFSQDVLESSWIKQKYPAAYKPISWIVKEEKYKGDIPFNKEMAIYMEAVNNEIAKGRGDKGHIVDFAIGTRNKNGKGKAKRIRLVEAKFDSKELDNIKPKDIKSKVYLSSSILIKEGIQISPNAVILINNSPDVQYQRRKLSNKLAGQFEVLTINDFHTKYFKK